VTDESASIQSASSSGFDRRASPPSATAARRSSKPEASVRQRSPMSSGRWERERLREASSNLPPARNLISQRRTGLSAAAGEQAPYLAGRFFIDDFRPTLMMNRSPKTVEDGGQPPRPRSVPPAVPASTSLPVLGRRSGAFLWTVITRAMIKPRFLRPDRPSRSSFTDRTPRQSSHGPGPEKPARPSRHAFKPPRDVTLLHRVQRSLTVLVVGDPHFRSVRSASAVTTCAGAGSRVAASTCRSRFAEDGERKATASF